MTTDKRRIFVVSFYGCLAVQSPEGKFTPNQDVMALMRGERECNPPAIFVVSTNTGDEANDDEAYRHTRSVEVSMLLADWDMRFAFVDTDPKLIREALGPNTDCTIAYWNDRADVYRSVCLGMCEEYVNVDVKIKDGIRPSAFVTTLVGHLKQATSCLETILPDSEKPFTVDTLNEIVQVLADLDWDLCVFGQAFGITERLNVARRKQIASIQNTLALNKVFSEEESK